MIQPPCVREALAYIENQYNRGQTLDCPKKAGEMFCLRMGLYEKEVFAVAFLDNRHRLIKVEEICHGTIGGASVHPREVVKSALHHNSAAVVLAHNHPSGVTTPSEADKALTKRLIDALALVETRVLDHIVVGGSEAVSFAELGLMQE